MTPKILSSPSYRMDIWRLILSLKMRSWVAEYSAKGGYWISSATARPKVSTVLSAGVGASHHTGHWLRSDLSWSPVSGCWVFPRGLIDIATASMIFWKLEPAEGRWSCETGGWDMVIWAGASQYASFCDWLHGFRNKEWKKRFVVLSIFHEARAVNMALKWYLWCYGSLKKFWTLWFTQPFGCKGRLLRW